MTEKVARVFISFTSQDLGDFATMLRDELEQIFDVEFMKDFGPEQMGAQVNSINHLRKSDFAIFLVSPYYGSLIAAECKINDCRANCLKRQGDDISYTHCEYEFARHAGKHRIIFYLEQAWVALERMVSSNQFTFPVEGDLIPFEQVRDFDPYFKNLTNSQLKTILLNVKRALAWKHEIDEVWCPIDNRSPEAIRESVKIIRRHLIQEIVKFHRRGMQFNEFFDRALLIEQVIENMNNHAIFINGVGGIGKSALAQLIAIFAWLEDRKIIIIDSGNELGNRGYGIFQTVVESIKDNDIVYYRAAN
ncbi:DUF4062 domain-containing protein, partial [Candidatus Bathyarchaeota archaeon]|nr:DUF4062 domain-containing protein [Candidatus Bathyarchaeota archaeon]